MPIRSSRAHSRAVKMRVIYANVICAGMAQNEVDESGGGDFRYTMLYEDCLKGKLPQTMPDSPENQDPSDDIDKDMGL